MTAIKMDTSLTLSSWSPSSNSLSLHGSSIAPFNGLIQKNLSLSLYSSHLQEIVKERVHSGGHSVLETQIRPISPLNDGRPIAHRLPIDLLKSSSLVALVHPSQIHRPILIVSIIVFT